MKVSNWSNRVRSTSIANVAQSPGKCPRLIKKEPSLTTNQRLIRARGGFLKVLLYHCEHRNLSVRGVKTSDKSENISIRPERTKKNTVIVFQW